MKSINLNGVNYRLVKKESKLGQEIINKYTYYEGVSLWDVYGNFSYRKVNAWKYCEERMRELKGFGLVITSHNIFQFTCAFEFQNERGDYFIAYFTRDNNYVVWLED